LAKKGIRRLLELKAPELEKLDAKKINDLQVPPRTKRGALDDEI
jgi:hypothetical protein